MEYFSCRNDIYAVESSVFFSIYSYMVSATRYLFTTMMGDLYYELSYQTSGSYMLFGGTFHSTSWTRHPYCSSDIILF